MFRKTTLALISSGLGCLLHSGLTHAADVDARADAMGGVGVALGHYYTAPLHNPALLSSYEGDDDFAIIINAGASGHGSDDIIDNLEEFVDAYDAFEDAYADYAADMTDLTALTTLSTTATTAVDELEDLEGERVDATFGASVVAVIPNQYLPLALFAKTSGFVVGVAEIESSDVDNLIDEVLDAIESEAVFVSALVTDTGVNISRSYQLNTFGTPAQLDFGLAPKFQQLATYHYRVDVDNFDEEFLFEEEDIVDETAFNFDAGVLLRYGQWRAGLSVQNFLSRELETIERGDENGENISYNFELKPEVTLGGGYYGRAFTVGADIDLTEQSGFEGIDMPQYAKIGLELNAWDWAQLRAGFKNDMNHVLENRWTAGIGFSPFGVLHIDVAADYASDSSVGAAVQIGLTF